MKRFLSLSMCLLLVASFASLALAKQGNAVRDYSDVHVAVEGPDNVLTSNTSSAARFKATVGTDTFCVYGGPGSSLGKFQDAATGVIPDDQNWIQNDVTDQPTLWDLSTFNAANLNNNGAGNIAMWAGQTAAQQPGWVSAPGYGNSWNALLSWRAAMVDPSVGQTVGLDFFFNHDSEPGYDFFNVTYDSAGANVNVYSVDASNKDASNIFQPPGLQYALQGAANPIVYAGNDYPGGEIVIKMSATSDGAWSDEDGLWPTDGGLAQVDDITVSYNDGAPKAAQVSFENFEGAGPYAWVPEKAPFAGFFGKVFGRISDTDPCRENITPVYGFIDDGTGPFNPSYTGPGTGGTTSINWSYGITGGFVVNYNGGVSFGLLDLDNEIYSPELIWDLPGTADDGVEVAGAFIRASIWRHLPLGNGLFYQWSVRGREDFDGTPNNGDEIWSAWANRNFVYYGGGTGDWLNIQPDVSDLLPAQKDRVQMQLAVRDLAIVFAFAGTDATPSPCFDNAAFFKYVVGGPVFATRQIDLFNDAFNQLGNTDASTQAGRATMGIGVDMARDVSTGAANDPGDSIIIDVTNVIPGASIDVADIEMVWALHTNPLFDDVRTTYGTLDCSNCGNNADIGGDIYTGTVAAEQSVTSAGAPVADRFFFDVPSETDFLFPGDVMEYYIRATDSGARTTTLPANIAGFGSDDTALYNRAWTVNGLPSIISDGAGGTTQPDLLLINDFGFRGGWNDYGSAFGQLGFIQGRDYDAYTVNGPSSGVSNGIGSSGAGGATAGQLAGYSCTMYVAGNLSTFLLSDGTNTGQNDKGDDQGVMTAWHGQAADRYSVYFGDSMGNAHSSLGNGSAIGDTFLATILGIQFGDQDVKDEIGGQTAPTVVPTGNYAGFPANGTSFTAYGGCLLINQFDSITPVAGAVKSHDFVNTQGAAAAAGVVWDRLESGFRKVDITFPYGFVYVWNLPGKAEPGVSARTLLLEEIMAVLGGHGGSGPAVGAQTAALPSMTAKNWPNPFNPKTTIHFSLGVKGPVTAKVYDLAGRLVKTLAVDQVFEAGQNAIDWNGVDNTGASVASGVYIAKIDGNGFTRNLKMALVK